MAFTKIESTDLIDKGVIGLPDTPGLSTAAMQAKLEETARGVIIPKHNDLIDELQAVDSASSLGANPPTGRTVVSPTVQGGLNKLSDDLKVVEDGMAQAIAESHSHPNKALLDTYTQTETDLADAVANKHAHSNKALLDTYTQTESDLADAVAQKHGHTNKALLDTYTQTDSDIADAIAQKHGHTNKAVIDKFGEDSGGKPTYDGNPIGGGSGDTFKTIVSGGQSFVASGEDTFKINAGSNVTITPLSSPDKGIQISATGGGQSTGDMLMTDYDSQGNVKTAGGIDAYVGNEIGKLDVADSAVTGQYVSAVSETDGKISVLRASLPTVDTTYNASSNNAQSGTAVAGAISTKADASDVAAIQSVIPSTATTSNKLATASDIPAPPNSGVLNIQQNGVSAYTGGTSFNADSNSAATANIVTDVWSAESIVGVTNSAASGHVVFVNLDDSLGYDLYCENELIGISAMTKTGSGTSMSIDFTVTGATDGTTKCKLRILR